MHLSLVAFKVMVQDQFFVLQLEPERAIELLPSLVPDTDARKALLEQVRAIVSAGDPLTAAENHRLALLSQRLATALEKGAAPVTLARPTASRTPAKTDAVLH